MRLEKALYDLGRRDRHPRVVDGLQNLDARALVAATAFFILTLLSFPKYAIVELIPPGLLLLILASLGDLSASRLALRSLPVLPFAALLGAANPLLDQEPYLIFSTTIAAGWVSYASLLLKSLLAAAAAAFLVEVAGFPGVCRALRGLGLPSLFVASLLFLRRNLSILLEEGLRLLRTRDQRSFGRHGRGIGVTSRILGVLFVRTLDRAERVHAAMLARGFTGDLPGNKPAGKPAASWLFPVLIAAILACLRLVPFTELIGGLFLGAPP